MLQRPATYDEYDSDILTDRQPDSDEATVIARHAPVEESAIFARRRRSERALYVPSALPMCELKKALARADDEATLSSAPEIPVFEEAPASSAPTRLHREPTPLELAQTNLDRAQDRRLASHVDREEERENGGWRYPVPPLPSLDEFAPIVGAYGQTPSALPVPGLSLTTTVTNEKPKRGGVGAGVFVVTLLVAAVIGIGIVHGDVTREDVRVAAAAVQRAAIHVVDSVKRL